MGILAVLLALLVQEGRNRTLADLPDNTWKKLDVPRLKRTGGGESRFAYDAKNKQFLWYGGCGPYTNESWTFDLGTEKWTMRFPHEPEGGADRPLGGCSRGLAYDSKRGVIWVDGNATPGHSGKGDSFLWGFDLAANTWTKPADRGPRLEANVMAYDSVNDALVTLGRGGESKTWVFDFGRQKWEGRKPPCKADFGYKMMTFDPGLARMVFFDGQATWIYDVKGDVWTAAKPPVEPKGNNFRKYAGMTYDSRNKVHIMLGGSGKGIWDSPPTDKYGDLWIYDAKANTWTEMKPKDAPSPSKEHALFAYDVEHNVSLLSLGGLWVYRYKK